jgi:hypothetical protein
MFAMIREYAIYFKNAFRSLLFHLCGSYAVKSPWQAAPWQFRSWLTSKNPPNVELINLLPHTTYELMFYTLQVSTNTNGFDSILQGMVLLAYMQIMEKLIFFIC